MPKFEILSNFNHYNCFGCQVYEVCEAGKIIDRVDRRMVEEVTGVFSSFQSRIVDAAVSGNSAGDHEIRNVTDGVYESMTEARQRYIAVSKGLDMMFEAVVVAQTRPKNELIKRSAGDAVEAAVDEFNDDVPYPTDLAVEDLQAAAEAIISYAKSDVCTAIEIS